MVSGVIIFLPGTHYSGHMIRRAVFCWKDQGVQFDFPKADVSIAVYQNGNVLLQKVFVRQQTFLLRPLYAAGED